MDQRHTLYKLSLACNVSAKKLLNEETIKFRFSDGSVLNLALVTEHFHLVGCDRCVGNHNHTHTFGHFGIVMSIRYAVQVAETLQQGRRKTRVKIPSNTTYKHFVVGKDEDRWLRSQVKRHKEKAAVVLFESRYRAIRHTSILLSAKMRTGG